MRDKYQRLTYLFICIDPVHVGSGGYRLGRVDNSIAREPGTNLPKIPGTSLHGAARAYAASLQGTPSCAGQGGNERVSSEATDEIADSANSKMMEKSKKNHCGKCPVCYTFGYTSGNDEQAAYSGTVNVFDAHIMFFPVHSMAGPVWMTTRSKLHEMGVVMNPLSDESKADKVLTTLDSSEITEGYINLGWLVLHAKRVELNLDDISGKFKLAENQGTNYNRWTEIKKRIVIVPEHLFSPIVNSNLEVRTSVAIDPERGAAVDGALFTYEALPRTTVLAAEVVIDDYRNNFPAMKQTSEAKTANPAWCFPQDVLDAGFGLIEWLGVGGMGTRGFGRMAILGKSEESFKTGSEEKQSLIVAETGA
ncbi:MAG: type III-B CRISPR module RAMP protein Cmr4 [Chlorobiaceae bacterium]|nr:type III-B CRISPR module RAMP protein Cmr4 [Chlorobiaceae bacterium]